MTKIGLGIILGIAVLAAEQTSGPVLPANCAPGDLFTFTGVTPSINVRCNANNLWIIPSSYAVFIQAMSSNPVDAQTTFFGFLPRAPITTASNSKINIRQAGIIVAANIYTFSTTAGSAESWSLFIRKNNTTDTLIRTLTISAAERVFANTSLAIPVAAGDFIEIKSVQPTWVTNPLGVTFGGYVLVQ